MDEYSMTENLYKESICLLDRTFHKSKRPSNIDI